MALTYMGDLSTSLDKVRFYIQDTTASSGPKPGDANFTDAELSGLITAEGSWQKAVAGAFEILASAWSKYADTQVGPRREAFSQIAERYTGLAEDWRVRHGSTGTAGSRHPTRIDGYSDDVSADEV